MESKFQILCNTHQACPDVKKVLKDLGFTNLKDMNRSSSFDISAKFNLENDTQIEEIARQVFEKCQEKVQSIQITVKD